MADTEVLALLQMLNVVKRKKKKRSGDILKTKLSKKKSSTNLFLSKTIIPNLCKFSTVIQSATKETIRLKQQEIEKLLLEITMSEGIHTPLEFEISEATVVAICNAWNSLYSSKHATKFTIVTNMGVLVANLNHAKYQSKIIIFAVIASMFGKYCKVVNFSSIISRILQVIAHELVREKNANLRAYTVRCLSTIIGNIDLEASKKNYAQIRAILMILTHENTIFVIEDLADLLDACSYHPSLASNFVDLTVPYISMLYEHAKHLTPKLAHAIGRIICGCSAALSEFGIEGEKIVNEEEDWMETTLKKKSRRGKMDHKENGKEKAKKFTPDFIFRYMDNLWIANGKSARGSNTDEHNLRYRWLVSNSRIEYYLERRRVDSGIHLPSEVNSMLEPILSKTYKEDPVEVKLITDIICTYCNESSAIERDFIFDAICDFLVDMENVLVKKVLLKALSEVVSKMGTSAFQALQRKSEFEKAVLTGILKEKSSGMELLYMRFLQSASMSCFACCARYLSIFSAAVLKSELKSDDFGDTSWIEKRYGVDRSKELPMAIILKCCIASAGLLSCVRGYEWGGAGTKYSPLSPPLEIPENTISSFLIFSVDLISRQGQFQDQKLIEAGCLLISSIILMGKSFDNDKSVSLLLSLWKDKLSGKQDYHNSRYISLLSTVLTYLHACRVNQRKLEVQAETIIHKSLKYPLRQFVRDSHRKESNKKEGDGKTRSTPLQCIFHSVLLSCLVELGISSSMKLVGDLDIAEEISRSLLKNIVLENDALSLEKGAKSPKKDQLGVKYNLIALPALAFLPANLNRRSERGIDRSVRFFDSPHQELPVYSETDDDGAAFTYAILFPTIDIEADGEQNCTSRAEGDGDDTEGDFLPISETVKKDIHLDLIESSKTAGLFIKDLNHYVIRSLLSARFLGYVIAAAESKNRIQILKLLHTKLVVKSKSDDIMSKKARILTSQPIFGACLALSQAFHSETLQDGFLATFTADEKEIMCTVVNSLLGELQDVNDRILGMWLSNALALIIPTVGGSFVTDVLDAAAREMENACNVDPYGPTPTPLYLYLVILCGLFNFNPTMRSAQFLSSLTSLCIKGACELKSMSCKEDCLSCLRSLIDTSGPQFSAKAFQAIISLRDIKYSSPSKIYHVLLGVNLRLHITQIHCRKVLPALGALVSSVVSAMGPELRSKANLPVFNLCSELAAPFMFEEWQIVNPESFLSLYSVGFTIERSLLVMNPYVFQRWEAILDSLVRILEDSQQPIRLQRVPVSLVKVFAETMRQFLSSSSAIANSNEFLMGEISSLCIYLFNLIDMAGDTESVMHCMFSLRNLLLFTLDKSEIGVANSVASQKGDRPIDEWIRILGQVIEGTLKINYGGDFVNESSGDGSSDAERDKSGVVDGDWDKKSLRAIVSEGEQKKHGWSRWQTKSIAFVLLRSTITTYSRRLRDEGKPMVCNNRNEDGFLQKDVIKLINVVSKACGDAVEGFQLLRVMVNAFQSAQDVSSSEGVEVQYILLQHVAELSMAIRSSLTKVHPIARANSLFIASTLVNEFHADTANSEILMEIFLELCDCNEVHKRIHKHFSWFSRGTSSAIKILTLTLLAKSWVLAGSIREMVGSNSMKYLLNGWSDLLRDAAALYLHVKHNREISMLTTVLSSRKELASVLFEGLHFVVLSTMDLISMLQDTEMVEDDLMQLLVFLPSVLLREYTESPVKDTYAQSMRGLKFFSPLSKLGVQQIAILILSLLKAYNLSYKVSKGGEATSVSSLAVTEGLSLVLLAMISSKMKDNFDEDIYLVEILEELNLLSAREDLMQKSSVLFDICVFFVKNSTSCNFKSHQSNTHSKWRKLMGLSFSMMNIVTSTYVGAKNIQYEGKTTVVHNLLDTTFDVIQQIAKEETYEDGIGDIEFLLRGVLIEFVEKLAPDDRCTEFAVNEIIKRSDFFSQDMISGFDGHIVIQILRLLKSISRSNQPAVVPFLADTICILNHHLAGLELILVFILEEMKKEIEIPHTEGASVDPSTYSLFLATIPAIFDNEKANKQVHEYELEIFSLLASIFAMDPMIFPPLLVTMHRILSTNSEEYEALKIKTTEKLVNLTGSHPQLVKDNMKLVPDKLRNELQLLVGKTMESSRRRR